MNVILISGRAGAGKDTFAGYLKETLEALDQNVLITHYADPLKQLCRDWLNWDGQKDEYGRALLQRVGTDMIRKHDPDFWVEYTSSLLKYLEGEWDTVIIPDTRFPNEVLIPKQKFPNAVYIHIDRPDGFVNHLTGALREHISERALPSTEAPADYTIQNDAGLDDLKYKAYRICMNIQKGNNEKDSSNII